jgi:hypothetical protein
MFNVFRFFGAAVAANLVARILMSLGVSFVTYTGFDTVLNYAFGMVKTSITGLPHNILCLLGLASVDIALNLLFSAYACRIAMAAMRTIRL